MSSYRLSVALLVVMALGGPAQAEPTPPPNWPTEARTDTQWLNAGDDSFAVLLKRSELLKISGTAILIPDAGKLAISPEHMVFLRQSLAHYGWDTLLISPPHWPSQSQQESGWQSYQTALKPRLEAALTFASELPGHKLIIAEGTSAASLLALYNQSQLPEPDGLVVLSPYLPEAGLNTEIPSYYGHSSYPLLDVYTPLDNRWASATVQARAIAAQKTVRIDYRQIELISQSWLTRQIHGWTDYLGW